MNGAVQHDCISFGPSAIHGIGAFARTDIRSGTRVIEYVGEKITRRESLRRCEAGNENIFAFDEEHHLDGSVSWNPARFINHSCAPNCEAEFCDGSIWIIARRDIRAGEEITFNYSYELEEYRDHPCKCGANGCVGYIVAAEYFGHVLWQEQLRTLASAGKGARLRETADSISC